MPRSGRCSSPATGGQVLAQVAERFQSCIRDDDMVARLFGDVFAGVCEGIDDLSTVDLIVHRLTRAFAEPYQVAGKKQSLTVNLGVAITEPGDQPEQALRRAENAMGHKPARRRTA